MGSADAMQHIPPGKKKTLQKEGAFLLESLSCDCEIVTWIWRTTFEQQHDPIHSTMLYTFRISYLVLLGASFWAITWLGPRMSKVQINFHHRFAKPGDSSLPTEPGAAASACLSCSNKASMSLHHLAQMCLHPGCIIIFSDIWHSWDASGSLGITALSLCIFVILR